MTVGICLKDVLDIRYIQEFFSWHLHHRFWRNGILSTNMVSDAAWQSNVDQNEFYAISADTSEF